MKKKIFFISFFLLIFLIQKSIVFANIKSKIIASVGDQIISSYELKNKVKTILFLSKQKLNQSNINSTKGQAMRTLIDYKLKKIEIKKYNINIEKNLNVDNYIKNAAIEFQTDENGFKALFVNSRIDYEIYLNEIMVELAWQKLIYSLYSSKVNLNEKEIETELKQIIEEQKNVEEFNLAEIEISFENTIEIKDKINEIKKQINLIGFTNAAIKFSESSSALEGGKLGWISSKSLAPNILKVVETININEITEPIIQPNSFTILKLKDKKKAKLEISNIEKIKEQIMNNKTNDLLNLYSNSHLSKVKNNTSIKTQ